MPVILVLFAVAIAISIAYPLATKLSIGYGAISYENGSVSSSSSVAERT